MRLVVIGNGATAVDPAGRCFVNRHTARFLVDLADHGARPTFIEPRATWRANSNLQDGELPSSSVRALPIAKHRLTDLVRAARVVRRATLVYIFFPGTLPRLVARVCRAFGRPYALYLRGQQFAVEGHDADLLRHARFVCTVGGLDDRVRGLNGHVVPIRPMLDIGPRDALRRSFGRRKPGPWRLLFVGRLEAAKGIPELIAAAEALRARSFPFRLVLVGGGPLHDELFRRYGNEAGGQIRVPGVIDNKHALHQEYEEADLFVLPSHHEGFPRVLYEAMIKSTVILTTFVGGIPGLMRAGVNCLEIACRDADSISRTVESVTAEPARMQALADAGLDTVLSVLRDRPSHLEAVLQRLHV